MKRNGFSLIELVVVIAIMGTLIAIGALGYSSMTRKAGVEGQVKTMYADLMNARSQALYRKTCRYVTVTGTQFSVYTSSFSYSYSHPYSNSCYSSLLLLLLLFRPILFQWAFPRFSESNIMDPAGIGQHFR